MANWSRVKLGAAPLCTIAGGADTKLAECVFSCLDWKKELMLCSHRSPRGTCPGDGADGGDGSGDANKLANVR